MPHTAKPKSTPASFAQVISLCVSPINKISSRLAPVISIYFKIESGAGFGFPTSDALIEISKYGVSSTGIGEANKFSFPPITLAREVIMPSFKPFSFRCLITPITPSNGLILSAYFFTLSAHSTESFSNSSSE